MRRLVASWVSPKTARLIAGQSALINMRLSGMPAMGVSDVGSCVFSIDRIELDHSLWSEVIGLLLAVSPANPEVQAGHLHEPLLGTVFVFFKILQGCLTQNIIV